MRRRHIFLTKEQWAALSKLADERTSVAELIRRAIDAYLKRQR